MLILGFLAVDMNTGISNMFEAGAPIVLNDFKYFLLV
jgi:hypothetical protein